MQIPKTDIPVQKICSNLQFYHHFNNKEKARGYDQLVGLIERHTSLTALQKSFGFY